MITSQTKVPAGSWNLDPVHSAVGFEVDYLAGTFRGQFRDVQVELDTADSGTRIEGSAEVASVDVKDENLAAHLQSPDFFDAERFPTLRFVAEDVDLDSVSVVVAGEITIKGVTKPTVLRGTLTGPTTDPYGNTRYGLDLKTKIDRTEFGLNWNADMPDGTKALANEVTLKAELSLVAAA